MESVGLWVIAVLVVVLTHWIYKWKHPKCANGKLPPGSLGLPFVGESLQLISPGHTLDMPPFLKKRIQKYGPIFKTNVAGRSVIVTADADFNYYIMQQDGKLVESWYLDAFAKVFAQGATRPNEAYIHKYIRNVALRRFGVDSLKDKLLSEFEELISETLKSWSTQDSVEVKGEAANVSIDFGAKQLFSYDPSKYPERISELFKDLILGLMSFPLNIPGTTYHKCLKNHKKVLDMMRTELQERQKSPENNKGDMYDHLIEEMKKEDFLTEDFIVQLMYSMIFVFSDSISTTLALSIEFLSKNPAALQELIAEHEAILKNRQNPNSPLTWEEYKSMTFTLQVINETLRLANIGLGLFRRARKDIVINGYTIPKGWGIIIASSGVHLSSNKYEDPLTFNPWRWVDKQSSFVMKNFMPFGFGLKQCAGAEYSRVFLSTFLHVLVTKYRFTKIKGGKILRAPIIRFPDGFHFKIIKKSC